LKGFVEKYVPKVLKVKKTSCRELCKTSETACVRNLCHLFDALCSKLLDFKATEDSNLVEQFLFIEKWFVFCLIWSIGATVEETSRKDIDYVLRDIESMFPHSNTVFDHFIDPEKKDWAPWDQKLPPTFKPQSLEFNTINVPTVDTVRNRFIV